MNHEAGHLLGDLGINLCLFHGSCYGGESGGDAMNWCPFKRIVEDDMCPKCQAQVRAEYRESLRKRYMTLADWVLRQIARDDGIEAEIARAELEARPVREREYADRLKNGPATTTRKATDTGLED